MKDKTAKEKNTEGWAIAQLLFDAGTEWQRTEKLLREITFRCNLALPTSEEELKWFDEGVDVTKSGDFMHRLFKRLDIGQEEIPNRKHTLGDCKRCGRKNCYLVDYNGHDDWNCVNCDDSLNREFDEEYR